MSDEDTADMPLAVVKYKSSDLREMTVARKKIPAVDFLAAYRIPSEIDRKNPENREVEETKKEDY